MNYEKKKCTLKSHSNIFRSPSRRFVTTQPCEVVHNSHKTPPLPKRFNVSKWQPNKPRPFIRPQEGVLKSDENREVRHLFWRVWERSFVEWSGEWDFFILCGFYIRCDIACLFVYFWGFFFFLCASVPANWRRKSPPLPSPARPPPRKDAAARACSLTAISVRGLFRDLEK